MTDPTKVKGEGDYQSARNYNDATREFAKSGKVDGAAEAAKPESPEKAAELERAEAAGKARAKEEDPNLDRGSRPGA